MHLKCVHGQANPDTPDQNPYWWWWWWEWGEGEEFASQVVWRKSRALAKQ